MKAILAGVLSWFLVGLAGISCAQSTPSPSPVPIPATQVAAPELDLKQIEEVGRMIVPEQVMVDGFMIPQFLPTPNYDREIVGLPKGGRPAVLSWEGIYRLAFLRAGSGGGGDGIPDFAEFRKAFLADAVPNGFRDPSAALLRLLGRREAIDNAHWSIHFYENLEKFLAELLLGESSGLYQFNVELITASKARVQRKRNDEIGQFRDGLDELKVMLGLSPRAEFILQRPSPSAFHTVRNEIDTWQRREDRGVNELPKIINGLPDLGEVEIDEQPILAALHRNSDLLAETLTRVATSAINNQRRRDKSHAQGNADVQLELRVRRQVRNLFETRRAYEGFKRRYALMIGMRDQTFEQLVDHRGAIRRPRFPLVQDMLELQDELLTVEDRVVGLWTSFQIERLAFYRDLGILPYDNWRSFLADLWPVRIDAQLAPASTPQQAEVDEPAKTPALPRR